MNIKLVFNCQIEQMQNVWNLLIKLRIESLAAHATAPILTGTVHKPELKRPAIGLWRSWTMPFPVNRRIPRAILDNPGRRIQFVLIMKFKLTTECYNYNYIIMRIRYFSYPRINSLMVPKIEHLLVRRCNHSHCIEEDNTHFDRFVA